MMDMLSVVSIGVPAWKRILEWCDKYPTYPRVPRSWEFGQLLVRDRGNWLKAQPAVYRWTNGVGVITH